jgi:hypothetical protein
VGGQALGRSNRGARVQEEVVSFCCMGMHSREWWTKPAVKSCELLVVPSMQEVSEEDSLVDKSWKCWPGCAARRGLICAWLKLCMR